MVKFLSFILSLIVGSSAFAYSECEVAERYSTKKKVQVLDDAEIIQMRATLTTDPDKKAAVERLLGTGASDAILQDRYPAYLNEVGCGDKIDPLTSKVKMTQAELARSHLIRLCKAGFPDKKTENEVWIKMSDYILRYRGKECAVFEFKF